MCQKQGFWLEAPTLAILAMFEAQRPSLLDKFQKEGPQRRQPAKKQEEAFTQGASIFWPLNGSASIGGIK
jgi:hypothetical protein